MTFGYSMQRWQDCFDAPELEVLRTFVARVNPSANWSALLTRQPRERGRHLNLWTDFSHYFDEVLERYGVVAPYDAVHLLPIDFDERGGTGAALTRCVNLRPAERSGWYVLDADWVHRSWRGHTDELHAHRCRAYATCFTAWMLELEPGSIEAAIESFNARADSYETVTSFLELEWIEGARAVCETGCPLAVYW